MARPEQQPREEAPYWAADIGLFEGRFRSTRDEPRIVRARVHTSEETYDQQSDDREIVPLATPRGTRTYVHLQPYLAFPDIRLTVGLSPSPRAAGAIGEVIDAEEVGVRQQPVGKAQAWYYPADRTVVLWECFLESPYRALPLTEDGNMRRLWLGVEDFLVTRFPTATRITTPFDDPIAERETYQAFLHSLDYAPVAKAAFGKALKPRV
ncbi:MAG: hypothetical protein ACYDAR_06740 [Thermomicrobiales bacterium]